MTTVIQDSAAASDPTMLGMAFAGMIVALLYKGILPYLLKRREAEEQGKPIPSFSTSYMTTFFISIITGFMGIMVTLSELELKLEGITSIMTAASIGFSFAFTALSVANQFVDLKYHNIAITSKSPETSTSEAEQRPFKPEEQIKKPES